jgi:hypothetical protein
VADYKWERVSERIGIKPACNAALFRRERGVAQDIAIIDAGKLFNFRISGGFPPCIVSTPLIAAGRAVVGLILPGQTRRL